MNVKNRVPEEKKKKAVVYQVPCKDCCKLYTGESKRTLKVRLAECKRAVQKSDVNNGIAMHVANTNHSIDWVNARVVKTVPGYWERRTTEAILIKKSQTSMNLDNGLLLLSVVLYCIVLNYYTGTPLSPVDYFPGSPVKVEHRIQDMKHKQTNKQTKNNNWLR